MTAARPAGTAEPAPIRLGSADRLQPVLLLGSIVAGLALGRAAPGLATALSGGVSVGVFALIYLVMLDVSPRSVTHIFTQRRLLGAAVAINFVANPLLAWGLGAIFLRGSPDLWVGLILFLVTPCIGWYLVFTDLAGGDTNLGVSLLGVNLVLQVALLPVYLALFTSGATAIPLATLTRSILLFLVLPAAAAAVTQRLSIRAAVDRGEGRQRTAAALKALALATVIVSMFASQTSVIFDNAVVFLRLLAPMVLFFAAVFAMALSVSGRLGLPREQEALLVFTTASRNSEASLAIAATAFASPLVGLTVVLGPVIELPLLIVMVHALRSKQQRVTLRY